MNRKPKYLEAEHGGQRERWLVSYTDFITILLILFVAIAAQGFHSTQASHPPQPHPAQPHPQPAQAVPKPPPKDPALVRAGERLRLQGLDSRLEKRGLVISLPQAILFSSGEDHVSTSALPIVSQVAEVLNSVPNKVALVGHADSVPIHNRRFRNNWELSAARSMNLLEVLTKRYGVPESRLSVESYGSNDPRDSNDTAAGRAENRRVDILLLDQPAQ
jgi:chemotaxis protein MotB